MIDFCQGSSSSSSSSSSSGGGFKTRIRSITTVDISVPTETEDRPKVGFPLYYFSDTEVCSWTALLTALTPLSEDDPGLLRLGLNVRNRIPSGYTFPGI